MVRVDRPRPLPWQVGHGSSTTSPRPRHSRQGSEKPKPPWLRMIMPVPSQFGQMRGVVPARAPVPRQVAHGASLDRRIGMVTPSTASVKPIVTSDSRSAPRRGCMVDDVRCRPVKMPPRMSPRPPLPAVVPLCWLSRSPRSKPNPPCPVVVPVPRDPPGKRKPPLPNSARASSYSLRRVLSDSTSYASEISLKRSSAPLSLLLASGWYLRASLRYDFLISPASASLGTPSTL